MNNTKTLTIVDVLMAATLVVGTVATTTTIAQSAFAYPQKKKGGGDENSRNGNTITIQKNKQDGTQSGFDNRQEQEAQNIICTHPSSSCVSEGSETPVVTNNTSSDDGEDDGGHSRP